MWENIVEPERPQTTIWRMRIACWAPKATNTHSEYCFSTATMVVRTRLNVTLYAHCLRGTNWRFKCDWGYFVLVHKGLRMFFVSSFEICKILISDDMYGVILWAWSDGALLCKEVTGKIWNWEICAL